MGLAGLWSQAGGQATYRCAGFWWVSAPKSGWPERIEDRRQILDNFVEPFGDRRQELVFIGIGLDVAALTAKLDACLLTDEEFEAGPSDWEGLPDPFPGWQIQAAIDAHHEHAPIHAEVSGAEDETPTPWLR
jgi:hypothetical protein